MRTLFYLIIGILFGITMYKSEAASWFRIYEMFRFESFHMYGIIGTALAMGVISTLIIKRYNIKSFYGETVKFIPKEKGFTRYMLGGIIFGLGWALAGACPGPMFTLLGAGFLPISIVIIAAILGTFIYGILKEKLPH
ncbi:MAG: YeeE/YedE thiosulfate transporter family protein [Bacteroidetes bacterium]|nr:YeeE/YedE thiosulfate transporter family protein [Bacteroidota bacterium]MDA0860654.1 YeeE/YedE thiosulfate transporter family protein [Bacteroidota bacterium]MDA1319226.1 YeeE/YedE thiosulfate transporter family protein [Bacteroidota bacterium]